MNLNLYDRIIIMFSGGKDSEACLLHLLSSGVDPKRIELWHQLVDGRGEEHFMDWPVTEDYCRRLAKMFGVPIYYQWKIGGFKREMWRDNQPTAATRFETPDGTVKRVGGSSNKLGTRGLFPQQSADLNVRWCSSYLKIDVGAAALRNQKRFHHCKTLVVTGERAQESKARAGYKEFEVHRADNREGRAGRHIDHWRPIHSWKEEAVWEIIERFRLRPHPAYYLGWNRLSCMSCIFGDYDQWASVRHADPIGFRKLADNEEWTGKTIRKGMSIEEQAERGTHYEMKASVLKCAMADRYFHPIFMDNWKLPQGAYRNQPGPS